jgi:hypothetical protein
MLPHYSASMILRSFRDVDFASLTQVTYTKIYSVCYIVSRWSAIRCVDRNQIDDDKAARRWAPGINLLTSIMALCAAKYRLATVWLFWRLLVAKRGGSHIESQKRTGTCPPVARIQKGYMVLREMCIHDHDSPVCAFHMRE